MYSNSFIDLMKNGDFLQNFEKENLNNKGVLVAVVKWLATLACKSEDLSLNSTKGYSFLVNFVFVKHKIIQKTI